ncbi:MAG: hypothetical protein QOG54_228 [Actinomycetota bacterium]|jgi:hypothetical protein|nr:hypothetical protein [Actinomycetota bacterium]
MKRIGSIAVALGAATILASSTLSAAAASKPQIEDPVGDANFVNDQGTGDGSTGDQTAADAGTVSDLEAITFSNDAKNLTILIDTEAAPPATTGIGYRVRVNPDGTGGTYCLRFEAYYPGANNALTAAEAYFFDDCAGGEAVPIEVLGTQLSIPRKLNKAFAKGAKLAAPQAQAFLYSGSNYPTGAPTGYADTTKVGTDYAFKK